MPIYFIQFNITHNFAQSLIAKWLRNETKAITEKQLG